MNTLDEFYAAVRSLAQRLDAEGHSEAGGRLRDAMIGGSTSGEVLERVWLALAPLEPATAHDADVRELRAYIDSVLGPA